MRTVYSKSAGDISRESRSIVEQDKDLQQTILRVTEKLSSYPDRDACLLCGAGLADALVFLHRDIPFCQCRGCGHMQTRKQPDEAYEKLALRELGYEGIYPELDPQSYKKRCERVYKPKADWIEDSLRERGIALTSLSCCDIGCGAGSFLYTLKEKGCDRLSGFDIDPHNLGIARKMVGPGEIEHHNGSLAEAIVSRHADLFTSFFVFEHVARMADVIQAMKEKPAGTFFAFAVPVFGFITLFESIIKDHYPRNLDAMMHTQLYTDASICYLLDAAGYEKIGEWVFGQDSVDLHRYLAVHLAELYPPRLYEEVMDKVSSLVDPLQGAVDRAHFSDARHVIAVRRSV